jgi:hypothetical protein
MYCNISQQQLTSTAAARGVSAQQQLPTAIMHPSLHGQRIDVRAVRALNLVRSVAGKEEERNITFESHSSHIEQ